MEGEDDFSWCEADHSCLVPAYDRTFFAGARDLFSPLPQRNYAEKYIAYSPLFLPSHLLLNVVSES